MVLHRRKQAVQDHGIRRTKQRRPLQTSRSSARLRRIKAAAALCRDFGPIIMLAHTLVRRGYPDRSGGWSCSQRCTGSGWSYKMFNGRTNHPAFMVSQYAIMRVPSALTVASQISCDDTNQNRAKAVSRGSKFLLHFPLLDVQAASCCATFGKKISCEI